MEIILVLIGVILGTVITTLILRTRFVGILRVDRSDPDQPYMFLELTNGMSNIVSKKQVLLKVKLESYIPHK